jgi:hypothetical protein
MSRIIPNGAAFETANGLRSNRNWVVGHTNAFFQRQSKSAVADFDI